MFTPAIKKLIILRLRLSKYFGWALFLDWNHETEQFICTYNYLHWNGTVYLALATGYTILLFLCLLSKSSFQTEWIHSSAEFASYLLGWMVLSSFVTIMVIISRGLEYAEEIACLYNQLFIYAEKNELNQPKNKPFL